MSSQNYQNHIRFYTPHHFIFYPVVLTSSGACAYLFYTSMNLLWLAIAGVLLIIAWLSFMVRQHYALNNQNRIVRLELRLRYYILTQQRLEPIERKLSLEQLAACRFASDEELPVLLTDAVTRGLTPDEIKKSIKNWQPDHMRV